jgi:hypothetical protein
MKLKPILWASFLWIVNLRKTKWISRRFWWFYKVKSFWIWSRGVLITIAINYGEKLKIFLNKNFCSTCFIHVF